MSAHTLILTAQDNGGVFPLRGDMDVSVDFIPTEDFSLTFVTHTTEAFVINFSKSTVRGVNGALTTTLPIGGASSLFAKIMYNSQYNTWDLISHNLIAGSAGGGVGGGAATGNREEVLLVADSNNVLRPDGAISNRFRFLLTANSVLADPVNFGNNEHIYLTGYQDEIGSRALKFGASYLLPSMLPFTPPQAAGAAFLMEARPTYNMHNSKMNWAMWGFPDNKTSSTGFGLITALVRVNNIEYYSMSEGFANVANGGTVFVIRNGLSAEVTATKILAPGENYYIYGKPVVNNGADKRPILELLQTDFGRGGANRPSYGKSLLNFEGPGGTMYVRDIRVRGARNDDSDARGLCNNAEGVNLIANNVEIYNCNNGILTGNQGMIGVTELYDVLIDRCGIGGPSTDPTHGYSTVGFTHSVYFGHNNSTVRMTRTSLTNAVDGNNLKCRTGTLILNQVLCEGSLNGRELEVPNGGVVEATNCTFWKKNQGGTGTLVLLGGNGGGLDTTEGLDTSRPRKYKFVNCLFRSDYTLEGRDGFLVCNLDHEIPVEFVDCKFEGQAATNNLDDPNKQAIYSGTITKNGIRYKPTAPPIFTYTGGPVGPILPVGYQPISMTATA